MQIIAQYTLTPEEALRGTRAFKRLWYNVSVGSGLLLLLMAYASNQMGARGQGIFMAGTPCSCWSCPRRSSAGPATAAGPRPTRPWWWSWTTRA